MGFSAIKIELPRATDVHTTEDTLTVDLTDGRSISVPLVWYPRLEHASFEERALWRIIGRGQGIHWEALDEDISVEALLVGKPSAEGPDSLRQWLQSRAASAST